MGVARKRCNRCEVYLLRFKGSVFILSFSCDAKSFFSYENTSFQFKSSSEEMGNIAMSYEKAPFRPSSTADECRLGPKNKHMHILEF